MAILAFLEGGCTSYDGISLIIMGSLWIMLMQAVRVIGDLRTQNDQLKRKK